MEKQRLSFAYDGCLYNSSFTASFVFSLNYANATPTYEFTFFDVPENAKSRKDVVMLEFPESLNNDLNSCFETLPCLCDFSNIPVDTIKKISLKHADDEPACEINIQNADNSSMQFEVERKTEDSSMIYYECRYKANHQTVREFRYWSKSWDNKCRKQLAEYASAHAVYLDKYSRTTPQLFCPSLEE